MPVTGLHRGCFTTLKPTVVCSLELVQRVNFPVSYATYFHRSFQERVPHPNFILQFVSHILPAYLTHTEADFSAINNLW